MPMMATVAVLTAALALGVSACSSVENTAKPEREIRYERTMCFGPCPAFEFVAYATGRCELTVRNPGNEGPLAELSPGDYVGEIEDAPDRMAELEALALKLNYLELDATYDDPRVMDVAAKQTVLLGHRVTNRFGGPDLKELYAPLQSLIDGIDWVAVTSDAH
jgi:hypothetical protein